MTCPRCGAPWTPQSWQCPRCGLMAQAQPPPQPWSVPAGPPRNGTRTGVWASAVAALVLVVAATAAGTVWFVDRQDTSSPATAPSLDSALGTVPTPTPSPTDAPEPTAVPEPTEAPEAPLPPGGDFAVTYEDVESGVLRILATTCEGEGIGTGFLIDRRTLATAAHVVEGAEAVAVDNAGSTYGAQVTGIDPLTDLALLRLDSPVPGHVFDFATSNPTPGVDVAAIGFPLNEPKTLTVGTVSGLDRTIRVEGVSRSGLLQTDTAINPGNSGGPLVTAQGEVVGVVHALRVDSQGIGYAVQVSVAGPALQQQVTMPAPAAPSCGTPEAPEELTVVPRLLPPLDANSAQVQETLGAYYNGINTGDYESVLEQFTPSYRSGFSADAMSRDLVTSFDYDAVIQEVLVTEGGVQAWTTFTSVQAPEYGPDNQDCTRWSLDYSFVRVGDRLLIDDVQGHSGDGYKPC